MRKREKRANERKHQKFDKLIARIWRHEHRRLSAEKFPSLFVRLERILTCEDFASAVRSVILAYSVMIPRQCFVGGKVTKTFFSPFFDLCSAAFCAPLLSLASRTFRSWGSWSSALKASWIKLEEELPKIWIARSQTQIINYVTSHSLALRQFIHLKMRISPSSNY